MKQMKLLLYCSKGKIGLYDNRKKITGALENFFLDKLGYDKPPLLNGKIVGECDFEVEEFDFISEQLYKDDIEKYNAEIRKQNTICKKSCLSAIEMVSYLDTKALGTKNLDGMIGNAVYIKNLHIFDKPKKTSEYNTYNRNGKVHIADIPIYTAPQNMMYAFDYYGNPFVLISIKPKHLCKILNGEKTIEVRKKVLKGMR